ncbi:MAG: hypothetical protein NTX69_05580, partial [Candidatus Bipolaricaulota bacterium]|nr:hypothetical protein [Candidatus Bipolaricaulota bacterium]
MNREEIQSIADSNFEIPSGRDLALVTGDLLPLLGSTDSHLREGTLEILGHWGQAGRYSDAELRAIGGQMAENLAVGLGESGTDTVFLRSFSALILEMVVQADDVRGLALGEGRKPFLTR